ncbi:MAG: ATP-binding cassette domain-containing protein [Deltaproteobacteria bacterium]|nr:ATP-binding cassette domain-containing protein [Deltaproteobacteria bacterium]
MSSDFAIETSQLTRRFGDLVAVDRVSLRVRTGSIFGLLGANGAGKSTLIKMLTTLLPPSDGSARVAGHDVAREPRAVRAHIGYVPQLVSADGGLTARENLLLCARLYAVPSAQRGPRIAEALEFMDLSEFADRLVKSYSGGMIRRLEIAQSLLHRPQVLFLDEPTVGLDPVARLAVWARLRELESRFGTTVMMTTHDMEEADTLCAQLAILHRGKLHVSGSPGELKAALGPEVSLEDVFVHHVGEAMAEGGSYRDVARNRRTAQRLQ